MQDIEEYSEQSSLKSSNILSTLATNINEVANSNKDNEKPKLHKLRSWICI